jgi:hypothetical protein
MRSFLRNIRSKPKAVRTQYALAISATFTGVVAVIWIVTGMSLDLKTKEAVETGGQAPFANLSKQIKEQWATVRAAMNTSGATTSPAVVEDPLTLTISPETKAEIADTTTTWEASSTASTSPAEYVIVQIATTSLATSSTETTPKATTTEQAAE